MEGLQKHLAYFPPRIQNSLFAFKDWESIREIRLRKDLPLSLTSYEGNLILDEKGLCCDFDMALRCSAEEIRHFLTAFCKGNFYRYFDTLKDGFLVDEDGWRVGICPDKQSSLHYFPEEFQGANLRIPRYIKGAATEFFRLFTAQPLASTLILSKPGEGKTTLLRDIAIHLSKGVAQLPPMRVSVLDEREELLPASYLKEAGLCDCLRSYEKSRAMEIATRLFAPQVIIMDEIGSNEEVAALLSCNSGGSILFASAHAASLEEARRLSHLKRLLDAGVFRYVVVLERIPAKEYRCRFHTELLK